MLPNKDLCTGCGMCKVACTCQCIDMNPDEYGFFYPDIDYSRCTFCNACEDACPVIHKVDVSQASQLFALKSVDEENRKNSSSGGAFFELASEIIQNGGIVCAAGYNDDFSVVHKLANTIEEVYPLRGAKYSQSRFDQHFEEIRHNLQLGKKVLFVGTPCQTAALYLNIDKHLQRTLILIDLICHGVPSPLVFQKYLDEQSKVYAKGSPVKAVNLRDKTTGWSKYSYCVSITFDNGITYQKKQSEDCFMQGFVNNLYLRSSCENCQFKGIERCSDLTLGDYWGVWDEAPEFDDDKGVSLLIVHSLKGQKLWEDVQNRFSMIESTEEQVVNYNPSAVVSSVAHPNKIEVLKMLDNKTSVQNAIQECLYSDNRKLNKFKLLKNKILKHRRG